MFVSMTAAAILIQTVGNAKAAGYAVVVLIGIFSVSFVSSFG